jgi:ATP-dependent exoDNAse (exonuclease V) beta subunit
VALTRARDHLVLSGAGGRSERGTWAEAIGAVPPALLERVRTAPARTDTAVPAGTDVARAAAEAGAAAATRPAIAPAPAVAVPELRPPVAARPVRIAVTELAEFRRCPRRHWWTRSLRLPEPREDERGGDDADRATVRGTLAHALLAEVDLLAPPLARRALLAASASRRGHDPGSPGIRPILEDVERFLASPDGDRLSAAAQARRLRREVPFLLRLDGSPATYLDGAIDALVLGKAGEVEVLDFKYAHLHPDSADRYRLQLHAYALAAARAFPGERVRATLQFLRGHARTVDVTPTLEEMARFAREAPTQALGAAIGEGRDLPPTTLGRSESLCRSEGCGFLRRCFPAAPP